MENRSEILFLYDVTNANPNGDPDENRPRMDSVTELNLVTDVRLKRTIRDYLQSRKLKIFVNEEYDDKEKRKTKDQKVDEFLKGLENVKTKDAKKRELEEEYIDLRLFGATLAIGGKKNRNVKKAKNEESGQNSLVEESEKEDGYSTEESESGKDEQKATKWIGPVQFKIGHSLHRVEPFLLKGTTISPSGEGKGAGTFTEFWYVPYSLIAFYGVVNELAAEDTKLKEVDIDRLLDAMWNGTKGLMTRSKLGQAPRFLMQISYDKYFHIGGLDGKLAIRTPSGGEIRTNDNMGKQLRSIDDLNVDISRLVSTLSSYAPKIRNIRIRVDDDSVYVLDEKAIKGGRLIDALNALPAFQGKVSSIPDDVQYQ